MRILLLFLSFSTFGQNLKIEYETFFNDKPTGRPLYAYAQPEKTYLTTERVGGEQTLYTGKSKTITYITPLGEGKTIGGTDTLKYKYTFAEDRKEILGYTCQKAVSIVNSNTIEIWFTNALPYYVAPSAIGIELGTVLEVVRNGNQVTRAKNIEKTSSFPSLPVYTSHDILTYRDILWKNRFTAITVLDHELINWNEETKAKEGVMRFANGTLLVKKVKFPAIGFDTQVFVELKQRSNGDAYDRTGSVFIIPESNALNFFEGLQNGLDKIPQLTSKDGEVYQGYHLTNNYLPNVELMRFFTSFGINHYNYNAIKGKEWLDHTSFRQEISELRSLLSDKEIYVGTYIGNYDKGGHEVSLEITLHKGENAYHRFDFALPLFNTVNVMEMGGQNYSTLFKDENGLNVEFTLEHDLKDAQLRYITTGHGGWGNGDEFLPKKNTIYLDNFVVHSFTPWRQDCGSYRLSNPVSGNFASGLSSSDLSRSNWCPATVTNPVYIELGDLKAGKHSIRVKIPQGQREGSSFSFWNVSGVLLGKK